MMYVGAAPRGHLLQRLEDVGLVVVDGFGARVLACHPQPVGEPVDGDDPVGAEEEGAGDGELADRSGAPHRDDVAR
jgi:hypothetical protein